ncbi:MAG: HAMP domain-containing histidine kinase [Pedobacter sp.]|nr:MAG: HAMP domain-containing histidine kinase [Pedobacter sp.]
MQSKAQTNELLQQKRYRNVLLISTILIIVIAGLIYRNYKINQKVNLLLDKKNQQLDIVNEQLNVANQAKTKLFSIISHDLRSPVSQLFTFLKVQQINSSQISEELRKNHQTKLLQSAANVLTTMEDLLLWSKSQMENFELDLEEIDLQQLFKESIKLMQHQADAKNVEIKIADLKVKGLHSDHNLLIIVLRNLLQNAINHAHPNTLVLLHAGLNELGAPYLSIQNQGDLISQEKIDSLMSNQYVKSKSSGYGLVIVKELLDKLNAKLHIKSSLDTTVMTVHFS